MPRVPAPVPPAPRLCPAEPMDAPARPAVSDPLTRAFAAACAAQAGGAIGAAHATTGYFQRAGEGWVCTGVVQVLPLPATGGSPPEQCARVLAAVPPTTTSLHLTLRTGDDGQITLEARAWAPGTE